MPARRASWACEKPEARNELAMIAGATALRVIEDHVSGYANTGSPVPRFFWVIGPHPGLRPGPRPEKKRRCVRMLAMGAELLYLRDAYLREFDATVVVVDGTRVALDGTTFY